MSLIRADASRLPLADESVDLIVTSPPYFALRSYTDGGEHYDGQIGSEPTPEEFLESLWVCTEEMRRVLKPSGSIFVNLGDKYAERGPASYNKVSGVPAKSLVGLPWRYAIGCVDRLGLILRAEIVWSKPNGLPESVTDRVRRSHEQWFHFTRAPRYFSAVDEIREPYSPSTAKYNAGGLPRHSTDRPDSDRLRNDGAPDEWRGNPLGKLPGSVWSIPTEPLKVPDHLGVDHFAAFPQEWPRRLILGWSPSGICVECDEGRRPTTTTTSTTTGRVGGNDANRRRQSTPDASWSFDTRTEVARAITGYACACHAPDAPTRPAVVLDPFAGTGTTVMVARALGRTGIGVDLSSDYLRLARWRVYESGHARKTIERSDRERQGALL